MPADAVPAAFVSPPKLQDFPKVSVVVPTYREAENLPHLVERLAAVRSDHGLPLEAIIVDDDSRDGTRSWAAEEAPSWVRLIVRTGRRGLSRAVLEGIEVARGGVIVVMDADLSHPPERIPAMLEALDGGAEFVIGSRRVQGASTDEDWHWFRRWNSRVATLLARPLTRARDPMAGFLAFPKALMGRAGPLDPVGYKIGLELIVKCGVQRLREIPIHFADRQFGKSKLTLGQQLRYLQHLLRLYRYRLGVSR
jgi:dolichol-phosphate mannosyltransferase